MKQIVTILILILMPYLCQAEDDTYIISQDARLTVIPVFQNWNDNESTLSEFTIPLSLYYPLSRRFSFQLTGNQASVSSEHAADLSGFTDTQLQVSYYLESARLVVNSGISIPSGKDKLSSKEFETSRLISLHHYNFYIPNFGQGLGLSLGATWAHPVTERIVIGAGMSYQYNGAYKPVELMDGEYKPGNEYLITAGVDVQLSQVAIFSIDGIFTAYTDDQYHGTDIYQAGNKIVLSAQYKRFLGYHDLWILARYRSRSPNSLPVGGDWIDEREKTIPDNLEFSGQLRFQIKPSVKLACLGNYRGYQESSLLRSIQIFRVGMAPHIRIMNNIFSTSQVAYSFGSYSSGESFSGYEFSSGLVITL